MYIENRKTVLTPICNERFDSKYYKSRSLDIQKKLELKWIVEIMNGIKHVPDASHMSEYAA